MQRQVDQLIQGPLGDGYRDLKDIVEAEEDDLLLSEGAGVAQDVVRPEGRGEARLSRWNPLGYGLLSYLMAWAPRADASPDLIDESGDLGASDAEVSSGR